MLFGHLQNENNLRAATLKFANALVSARITGRLCYWQWYFSVLLSSLVTQ